MANIKVIASNLSTSLRVDISSGTWVPMTRAITLAQKYNVYDVLRPLFDYQAGTNSPPPAPKHTTAANSKPKAPKAPAPRKVAGTISDLPHTLCRDALT